MRLLLGLVLIAHGIAHGVGFVVPWRLVTARDVPYRTTILGGSIDIGEVGVRSVGLVWLAVGVAVVALGAAVLAGMWSYPVAIWIVLVSLAICVVGLPDARIGLVLNALLLVSLVAMRQFRPGS